MVKSFYKDFVNSMNKTVYLLFFRFENETLDSQNMEYSDVQNEVIVDPWDLGGDYDR